MYPVVSCLSDRTAWFVEFASPLPALRSSAWSVAVYLVSVVTRLLPVVWRLLSAEVMSAFRLVIAVAIAAL